MQKTKKAITRVRTGCITCRIRKIKCDETRPACDRCVRTGRKCDGYTTLPPNSTTTSSSPRSSRVGPHLHAAPGFDTVAKCRAFDFFKERAAPVLGDATDSGFWGGLVLRLSLTEPIIQHAVTALSALHESFPNLGTGVDLQKPTARFGLVEYGKAIRAMCGWTETPSAVPLLACVLFACIEFLLKRNHAAQLHICAGRKMLAAFGEAKSPANETIKNDIVPVFARLGLSCYLSHVFPVPIPASYRPASRIPARFASMVEARLFLYLLQDDCFDFVGQAKVEIFKPCPDPNTLQTLAQSQQYYLGELEQWKKAFAILTHELVGADVPNVTKDILLMQFYSFPVCLATALSKDETPYDSHVSAFIAMMHHATAVLDAYGQSPLPRHFSLETELIAPLFWIVSKCRHAKVRRAALNILTRDELRNRTENLWHATERFHILWRIIELEETGRHPSKQDDPGAKARIRSNLPFDVDDIHVPASELPMLPPSFLEQLNEFGRSGSGGSTPKQGPNPLGIGHKRSVPPPYDKHEDLPSLSDVEEFQSSFKAPFEVPESNRIKSLYVGTRENGDVWMITFRDPIGEGTEWRVDGELT